MRKLLVALINIS